MKQFYDPWTEDEIKEWIDIYNAIVLFEAHWTTREVKLVVHGKMTKDQIGALSEAIARHFGGVSMTQPLCNKINEFAQKWYNKVVLKKKARVLNSKRKKR